MTSIVSAGTAEFWGPLWGGSADDWAETEAKQLPTYEEAIRRVGITAGDRVLDIGCGSGVFLRAAADLGARVAGLDASGALLEVARSRVPEADLRVGEMQALPYDDDEFDVVTGFNSFFFAADMVAALREAARVARPGGAVVIQVFGRPERSSLDAMKEALQALLPEAPRPSSLWEEGVLERAASEAGLAPERAFDALVGVRVRGRGVARDGNALGRQQRRSICGGRRGRRPTGDPDRARAVAHAGRGLSPRERVALPDRPRLNRAGVWGAHASGLPRRR